MKSVLNKLLLVAINVIAIGFFVFQGLYNNTADTGATVNTQFENQLAEIESKAAAAYKIGR